MRRRDDSFWRPQQRKFNEGGKGGRPARGCGKGKANKIRVSPRHVLEETKRGVEVVDTLDLECINQEQYFLVILEFEIQKFVEFVWFVVDYHL